MAAVEMKLNAVPVAPGIAGDNRNFVVEANASKPAQCFTENRRFLFELIAILGVLLLAAAAVAKILASRFNASRRSLEHLHGMGSQQISFSAFRFDFDALAGQCERRKQHLPVDTGQCVAAIHPLLNIDGDLPVFDFERFHPLR
jgi:hypothetical protein